MGITSWSSRPNPDKICSVASVAAHTLYERSDPYRSSWPGGQIDLTETVFEQYDARKVKISGTRFLKSGDYWVKLEGAARVGYRTITIAGIRDPLLLENFDQYEANARAKIAATLPHLTDEDYRLIFHVYGRDGVMGSLEPRKEITSHELGLVIEVVAPTEELSRTVLAIARSVSLHTTYPGRKAIAGNLAFPFSPSDIGVGETSTSSTCTTCLSWITPSTRSRLSTRSGSGCQILMPQQGGRGKSLLEEDNHGIKREGVSRRPGCEPCWTMTV